MEKLKINEVRVGNWVAYRSPLQYDGLAVLHTIDIPDLENVKNNNVDYEYFGIPLSEEFFADSVEGFEEKSFDSGWQCEYGWYNEKYDLWLAENKYGWSLCHVVWCPNSECNINNMVYIRGGMQYVHELQNMWYAITGDELEIEF